MDEVSSHVRLDADSEEKRELVSDIDTAVVDSLKVLDPKRPIREADIQVGETHGGRLLPAGQGLNRLIVTISPINLPPPFDERLLEPCADGS
jgi:hypothetical protein